MRTLGKYRIKYKRGASQDKFLISHTDYLEIIVPKSLAISELDPKKDKSLINDLKDELRKLFTDEWFTDKSPLYMAFYTQGVLELHENQGGKHLIEIRKL